jgi:hypothetical protein
MDWRQSAKAALGSVSVQLFLSFALILPFVATVGQYWASGFFRQTVGVDILFWPGAGWHWAIPMSVALVVAVFSAAYIGGIAWLVHRRTLGAVILAGIGTMIAASLAGRGVNHVTGWKELQAIGSMGLGGRVDRAILALWHNPIWEEVVFRGLPLLAYTALIKRRPRSVRLGRWCYFLVPAVAFAAYHVPGHGYSRITDTFVLSLAFSWLVLRYGFCSVVVLHDIFDTMMILSLATMQSIPKGDIRWLSDHAGVLNTSFSTAALAACVLVIVLFVRHLWKTQTGG